MFGLEIVKHAVVFSGNTCSLKPSHEFASISAHTALILSFFSFASSRFRAVRSSRAARKHLLTSFFNPLHIPAAL